MNDIKELQQMQSLPLEIKIMKTQARIREWVQHFGLEDVYVSFSGGKDSTVLLDIARKVYPKIEAVFIDTGLEYPEIREFVKTFDNVVWLHPKMNFYQVIKKYGYPLISKEVSECIAHAKIYFADVERERESKRYAAHASKLGANTNKSSKSDGNIEQRQQDKRGYP